MISYMIKGGKKSICFDGDIINIDGVPIAENECLWMIVDRNSG